MRHVAALRTLARRALRSELAGSRIRNLLRLNSAVRDVATALSRLDRDAIGQVLIVTTGEDQELIQPLTVLFSGADIHVAVLTSSAEVSLPPGSRACPSLGSLVDYACELPPLDVVVQGGANGRRRKKIFADLLWFVKDRGHFIIVFDCDKAPISDAQEFRDHITRLQALPGPRKAHGRGAGSAELAQALGRATFIGDAFMVEKEGESWLKVRERRAETVLPARLGERRVTTVLTRPPEMLASLAEVTGYGHGPTADDDRIFKVPALHLRTYQGVRCWSQQRVAWEGTWLPDTFRHPAMKRLRHRALVDFSATHAALPAAAPRSARSLPGSFFYLDTEYPHHFGHVTTEVLARIWGWRLARERAPSIRPLMSLKAGHDAPPAWQTHLLASVGIPTDRIEFIAADEAVDVEELWAATPALAMPHYISAGMADIWDDVVNAFGHRPVPTQPRIFVSRRPGSNKRECRNVNDVEAMFESLGFSILFPEDHDFRDQVAMFAQADVIAGFAGSGMFGTMFAEKKNVILLSGNGYTANNEFLIASVRGHRLTQIWSPSEIAHPAGGWTWTAFHSASTCDVDLTREAVLRALSD